MANMAVIFRVCLVKFLAISTCLTADYSTVTTDSGKIKGNVKSTAAGVVNEFLGIPFAEPPTGKQRFKPPTPVKPWTDTLDALANKPSCLQQPTPSIPFELVMSEDCLYLDIYTPASSNNSVNLKAVLVYIHGGGFSFGSPTLYPGGHFVTKGDIVSVAIPYRLGLFGSFAYPAVNLKGNLALLDQVQALKWIKQNIKYFGGDPDKITVWGFSAGSISTSMHMVSPLTRGLFNRVILESGSSMNFGVNNTARTEDMVGLVKGFAQEFGCSLANAQQMLKCLQDVDGEKFLKSPLYGLSAIMPFVDGSYLTDTPINMFRSGMYPADVDVIIGSNSHEGDLFLMNPQNIDFLQSDFNETLMRNKISGLVSYVENRYRSEVLSPLFAYTYLPENRQSSALAYQKAIVEMASDMMRMPITQEALYYSDRSNAATYLYTFSHRPSWSFNPSYMKAAHSDFSTLLFYVDLIANATTEEFALRDTVTDAWTKFVKFGDPGNGSAFLWPKLTDSKLERTVIVTEGFTTGDLLAERKKISLWNDVILRVREETTWCKPPVPEKEVTTSEGRQHLPSVFLPILTLACYMCHLKMA